MYYVHMLYLLKGALSHCCARDGQGSGPIHITNVGCVGNELSLTDCPHTTDNNCNHREDASVQCQTSKLIKSNIMENNEDSHYVWYTTYTDQTLKTLVSYKLNINFSCP